MAVRVDTHHQPSGTGISALNDGFALGERAGLNLELREEALREYLVR